MLAAPIRAVFTGIDRAAALKQAGSYLGFHGDRRASDSRDVFPKWADGNRVPFIVAEGAERTVLCSLLPRLAEKETGVDIARNPARRRV